MGDFYDKSFSSNSNHRSGSPTYYQEPPLQRRPDFRNSERYQSLKLPPQRANSASSGSPGYSSPKSGRSHTGYYSSTRQRQSQRSTQPSAGRDRWDPEHSQGRWKRVEGQATSRTNTPQKKAVSVTTTSGRPVYQTSIGSRQVYGWRSKEGVATFSDRKPPLVPSGWGNK